MINRSVFNLPRQFSQNYISQKSNQSGDNISDINDNTCAYVYCSHTYMREIKDLRISLCYIVPIAIATFS